MASEDQQHIVDYAERIGVAFMDAYHERDGVFEELKAVGGSAYANSMRGGLAVMGELGIHADGPGEVLLGGSIWIINDHHQIDTNYGWEWADRFDADYGFFMSEQEAQTFADELNEKFCRNAYNAHKAYGEQKHDEYAEKAEKLAKQNAALRAAGLDPIEGDETSHLAPYTPIPFEDFIKSYHNSRDSYFTIEEIRPHKEAWPQP